MRRTLLYREIPQPHKEWDIPVHLSRPLARKCTLLGWSEVSWLTCSSFSVFASFGSKYYTLHSIEILFRSALLSINGQKWIIKVMTIIWEARTSLNGIWCVSGLPMSNYCQIIDNTVPYAAISILISYLWLFPPSSTRSQAWPCFRRTSLSCLLSQRQIYWDLRVCFLLLSCRRKLFSCLCRFTISVRRVSKRSLSFSLKNRPF